MTRKTYDWDKICKTVKENKDVLSVAQVGMLEDWYWTSETIWEDGEWLGNYYDGADANFIQSSLWATPALRLVWLNGRTENIPAFIEDKDTPVTVEYEVIRDVVNRFNEDSEYNVRRLTLKMLDGPDASITKDTRRLLWKVTQNDTVKKMCGVGNIRVIVADGHVQYSVDGARLPVFWIPLWEIKSVRVDSVRSEEFE